MSPRPPLKAHVSAPEPGDPSGWMFLQRSTSTHSACLSFLPYKPPLPSAPLFLLPLPSPKMRIPTLPLGHPPHPPPLPSLGLGTWKAPKGVTAPVVTAALRAGYRMLDCACDYGNEQEVGAGISDALSAATVTRDDIFVTSKLWNTFHKREHVKPALLRSLADLRLQKLDLYLMHFPISLAYTWKAMEALVDEGLVSHIGVCNFPAALLMDLLSYARIKPAVLQVEMHPYLQQVNLLELCKREGVQVTAFSPLGASSYVELNMDRGDRLLDDPVLKKIAEKKGCSVAQVALRWGVQRGTSVIPKTCKVERLGQNMDVFGFELDKQEMAEIAALDRGTRYNDPGVFCKGMGHSIPIYD
ncbi:unnamed protein product [Chondrus crispus]|uniref:NADP-dependent oxidoreductase domain-containing protein n=1 Tax=Chondrus crispus TaxID=2769 RepID=R7QUL4_CHOCR|nr:unnamed protein product [Chondrus crispus]CDF41015.1 unnamed protein product [Chondrus crispus]|eukprot:XP_005711309.1 unnamed protein product [Chondrus crispus]